MNREDFTSEEAYQCYKRFLREMDQGYYIREPAPHVEVPMPTHTMMTATRIVTVVVGILWGLVMAMVFGLYL